MTCLSLLPLVRIAQTVEHKELSSTSMYREEAAAQRLHSCCSFCPEDRELAVTSATAPSLSSLREERPRVNLSQTQAGWGLGDQLCSSDLAPYSRVLSFALHGSSAAYSTSCEFSAHKNTVGTMTSPQTHYRKHQEARKGDHKGERWWLVKLIATAFFPA